MSTPPVRTVDTVRTENRTYGDIMRRHATYAALLSGATTDKDEATPATSTDL